MKGLVVAAALLSVSIGVRAQYVEEDTLRYRVMLKDKNQTEFSLKKPSKYLSKKAIQRRKRQGIEIDSTDLPVCKAYVEAIKAQGAHVIVEGKWENFVTVSCNDERIINEVSSLPFVDSTIKVRQGKAQKNQQRDSLFNDVHYGDSLYGSAFAQLALSGGDKLHNAGFMGQGMTIAVIDAGFHNTDIIPVMDNINILGTRDFVCPSSDIFAENTHGTSVLSCMAMNKEYVMIGSAPQASYWLLRSEDAYSETLVEQDYWAAAIEFADSVGVDIVNVSLGYYTFDDSTANYNYRDLNGKNSLISRQASKVAQKGMIMVCSAGNAGAGSWKKITPPADAENVLTVGAIDRDGKLAPFSSIGNTADGRIKPDVVAVGLKTDIVGANGKTQQGNGTSFASPIMCGMVACLWQACPQLTAMEVINLVRQSGDRAQYPDNIYGYGIPDLWQAYLNTISPKTN